MPWRGFRDDETPVVLIQRQHAHTVRYFYTIIPGFTLSLKASSSTSMEEGKARRVQL